MTDASEPTTEPTEPVEPTPEPAAAPAAPPATVTRRSAGALAAGMLVLGALLGFLTFKAFADDDGPQMAPVSFQQGGFPGGGPQMGPGGGYPRGGPQGGFPEGGPPWMHHGSDEGGYDDSTTTTEQPDQGN